jgi:hypothetical protein
MLVRTTENELVEGIADLGLLASVMWYSVAAFRGAYGGTWRRAAWRAALVLILYVVVLAATMAGVVGVALYFASST